MRQDLSTALLPDDMRKIIVENATKSWFNVQHRSWVDEVSKTESMTRQFVPHKGLNAIERVLQEQMFILDLKYDRASEISSVTLSNQEMSDRVQQKSTVIARQHRDLLISWALGWKFKSPGCTYLLSNRENVGFNSDAALGLLNLCDPAKSTTAGLNDNSCLSNYFEGPGNCRNPPITPDNSFNVRSSGMMDYHTIPGFPQVFGRQHMAAPYSDGTRSYRRNLPHVEPGMVAHPATALSATGLSVPARSPASKSTKNVLQASETQSEEDNDEAYGEFDVFEGKPSSKKEGLVDENASIPAIINLYPNHLSLRHVMLRLVEEKWAIAHLAELLMKHPVMSGKKPTDKTELQYRMAWVKRQRERATHMRLNKKKAEAKRQGRELPKKFTKEKGTKSKNQGETAVQPNQGAAQSQEITVPRSSTTVRPMATPTPVLDAPMPTVTTPVTPFAPSNPPTIAAGGNPVDTNGRNGTMPKILAGFGDNTWSNDMLPQHPPFAQQQTTVPSNDFLNNDITINWQPMAAQNTIDPLVPATIEYNAANDGFFPGYYPATFDEPSKNSSNEGPADDNALGVNNSIPIDDNFFPSLTEAEVNEIMNASDGSEIPAPDEDFFNYQFLPFLPEDNMFATSDTAPSGSFNAVVPETTSAGGHTQHDTTIA